MAPAPDRWVRPLGPTELYCHDSYVKQDCLLISYVLRLNTSQLVTEAAARTVFETLIRKAPNLRMYVEEKDGGDLWFREMAEPRIDFEVVPNADPYEEYHKFAHHRYSSSGPFWAVKLLPWSPEQEDFVNKTKMEDPEEASKLPFVCHILLSSNHSITDGYTFHQVIKMMLGIFDEVLEGKPVVDIEDASIFLDRGEENQIVTEIENEFKNKIRNLPERSENLSKVIAKCILPEGYKVPIGNKFATDCLTKNLDKQTTKLFIKRCKKEGVTFHSGFTAVLDAAYVKLHEDGKVETESYIVSSLHCINKRQYFKADNKSFGNSMGLMDTCVNTNKNIIADIWGHAKKVHEALKEKRTMKAPFELYALENLEGTSPLNPLNTEDIKERSIPPIVSYCTSNMLNVTGTFGDSLRKFGNIRLDWYDRLSTIHIIPTLWCSVYQTYNDQLMHSLQYNAGLMSATTAQKLSDNIFEIVTQIA